MKRILKQTLVTKHVSLTVSDKELSIYTTLTEQVTAVYGFRWDKRGWLDKYTVVSQYELARHQLTPVEWSETK